MYKRRRNAIDENNHRDPAVWGNIKKVLTDIGIQGMSGDETDSNASSSRFKGMRRLKHPWLNPKIMELWVALDSYEDAINDELLVKIRNRRGNAGLPRSKGARQDSSVPASKFLPRNWYSDDWWKKLSEGAQLEVAAEDPVEIPTLVLRSALPRQSP